MKRFTKFKYLSGKGQVDFTYEVDRDDGQGADVTSGTRKEEPPEYVIEALKGLAPAAAEVIEHVGVASIEVAGCR